MSEYLARTLTSYLRRVEPEAHPDLDMAVLKLMEGLQEGYVCLDASSDPSLRSLFSSLRPLKKVVGSPGDFRPLILDGPRLYLARYWQYEKNVADALIRLARPLDPQPSADELRRAVKSLAPDGPADSAQTAAMIGAATRHLAIIHGGPGTGKTTTVAKILALRLMLNGPGKPLSIKLAAPTGKAADRLRESILRAKSTLTLPDEIRSAIPEESSTIHRLLGIHRDTGMPRHTRENPFGADLVVLDEASMIDLSLLARVLDAIPARGSLILLGDKNQLDAVQPGHVFGDISSDECGALRENIFGLTKSYRFDVERGIGSFAGAVNAGDEDAAVRVLQTDASGELDWKQSTNPADDSGLREPVMSWLKQYFALVNSRASEAGCFEAFNRYRLLTPLRNGPGDVSTMNRKIEEWLRQDDFIAPNRDWYPGRPIIITVNNHSLGLYNGDVGLALEDAAGKLSVAFPGSNGTWRRLSPGRLPEFELAYASTVHKSQGSEFDNVILLIPSVESPVIGRNLLYTGITRAKKSCQIWGSEEAIRAAIGRKSGKGSGLADRLG